MLRVPKMQGAMLVATDVADQAAFERCQKLGFTYFQGEYFAQPRTFTHRGVATTGIGALRKLSELTSGDVSFEDLERIISSDIGLSLKLLRYVNSAFFALPRTVSSVQEALNLLGVRTVSRWATVMVISTIPDVPDELVALGLRRARMCEMLAGQVSGVEKEMMFTIGLFSVADALLDMSDDRRADLAPVHRGDPGRTAAPRRPQGRDPRHRRRLRARRVPDAPRRQRPFPPRPPTAPRWSGPTKPAASSPDRF